MKTLGMLLTAAVLTAVTVSPSPARDLKDKVKVEIESVGLHPGMDPGMYVCAAFNSEGKLLGTAAAATKVPTLAPGDKAEVNLEFLTVTGPAIQQVKRHEVTVVEAPSL